MKESEKQKLRKEFDIQSVGTGKWGEGFYDCLRNISNKHISLFNQDHIIKRILFAQKNTLPYSWLLTQLNNDYERSIGKPKPPTKQEEK